jgi:hypothetical protein
MVPSAAAGYDAPVAGIDEVSARSVLAAMQDRLARDPTSALGLGANATTAEVRAAFLQLTKQYHPVRFGRMAVDIQKLSNEVFLALRAAHDALQAAHDPRPKGQRHTGAIPVGARGPMPSALGSQSMAPSPAPPASTPLTIPPPSSGRGTQPLSVKPARTRSPNDTGERPPVPPRALTPPTGVRIPATRPPGSPPAPGARAGIPGVPGVARPTGPLQSPQSANLAGGAPASAVAAAQAGGAVAGPAGAPQPTTPRDEAAAIDLLQRQQWDQARSVLHQLAARDPSSKKIRALMCYARGREAQLDRRVDDARVELQDALELDPELQLAKTALTELVTRRK